MLLFALPALALALYAGWRGGLGIDRGCVAWFCGSWLPFVALSLFWQRTSLPLLHGDRDAGHLPRAGATVLAAVDARWALGGWLALVAAAVVLCYPFVALRRSACELPPPPLHPLMAQTRENDGVFRWTGAALRVNRPWASCSRRSPSPLPGSPASPTRRAVRRLDARNADDRRQQGWPTTSTGASWPAARRRSTLRHVTGAADLLSAVAADNRAATRKAVSRIVLPPTWHIVRLQALDASGRILADIGGPYVIARCVASCQSAGASSAAS